MVAIFTGVGSGLERGSGSVLGGAGLLGSAFQGWGGEGIFVNASTGNLLVQKQDEVLIGKGPDIAIARTYNSQGALPDDNDDKWRQSTDRRIYGLVGTLNAAGSTLKRVSGDGTEITYAWNSGSGAYLATDGGGAYDQIVKNGSEWVWTDGDSQTVERYYASGTGKIKSATDRNGSSLTFAYDGSDRLTTVTSSDGAWTRYDYSGSTNKITQIVTGYTDLATSTAKTLTRTRYGYDGSNRLSTVTVDLTPGDNSVGDGATYVTTYSYDGSGRVSNIAQSDGSNLAITYDGSNRVQTLVQTESSGVTRTTSFAYGTLYTSVTDPSGQVTRLDYDAAGNLTKITAPPAYSGAAQQIVQFAYNGNGDLTSTTDAAGQVTAFSSFTANGLAQTVTDRLGGSVTRTYSSANLLLSETRSGVDTSGAAASQTARYVYNMAGNLRFAVSAEGRVTEYTRDSAGQVTYETVYAEAAYTTAGTPTEANLTSWVSGLSDKSWVQKTKYLYDARGALLSATSYGIANSGGTEQTSEGTSVTSFVYDQAGQLLSSYSGSNTATSYVYDGMGRMTSTTDANGGTTTIAFSSSSLTTTITLASGYVTTKTYNKAGDLVSVTDSGANTAGGTTAYAYDKLGRVRVRTDANALKTYTIYDNAGRMVGSADNEGHLTEYFYDANNRLVGNVRYRDAVSSGALTALNTPTSSVSMASIRPAAHAEDISSWTVYDAEGRVLQTIAGDGSTTISVYDAAGRLQKTTAYTNKIAQGTVNGYVTAPPTTVTTPTASSTDTVARVFYDKDGLVIGSLGGEGYLTQNTYDKAGQLVATTAYATVTTAGLRASGSFTSLLASVGTSAQDRTSRFVYDGQGLLRYTVDALSQVVRYDYDSAGNKVRTAVYAAALGATSDYTFDNVKGLATSLEASPSKRVAWGIYDAAGRLAYGVAADGAVTGYTYDTSGRVTTVVQYEDLRATTSLPAVATMDSWAAGNSADPGNRVTLSWYTARGEAAYVVDAEGYASLSTYDAAGQLTSLRRFDTPITVSDSTTYAQVTSAIGADTYVTSAFEYDSLGRVTAQVDALGTRTTYTYLGATSLKTHVTRAANGTTQEQAVTHVTYDHAGRAVQTVDGEGTAEAVTSSQTFDGRDNLTTSVDPRSHTTTYAYDLDGQVKTVTDSASGVTSFDYNAFGEVWKTTDPTGNVSYAWYDKLGRQATSRDAAGYLTQSSYTAFGEIGSVQRWMTAAGGTPAMGTEPTGSGTSATTSFTYDAMGRVLTSTDALTNAQSYTYDAFGNRITSTNKLTSTTSYAYDRLGRLVRQGVQAATTNYTAATGSGTSGSYIVTTYAYGAHTQTMVEGYAAAALTGTVTALRSTISIYDAAGQLTTVTHDAVTAIADDMVTTSTVTPTETYAYDKRGNVIKSVDAGGAATYSYYDDLDRKKVEVRQLAADRWVHTAYAYDANGNLTDTKVYEANAYPSGTPPLGAAPPSPPSGAYRQTTFTYDDLDRMLTSSVVGAANAIISGSWNGSAYVANAGAGASAQALTTSYEYDANGNVVKLTDPNGNVTWSWYDSLGHKSAQLDGEKYLTKWSYDGEGNVLSETRYNTKYTTTPSLGTVPSASTDAADRITDFEYDLAGNRTKETRRNVAAWVVNATTGALTAASTTNAVIEYTYNALGLVTEKKIAGGTAATYAYDATGRLTSEAKAAFTDAGGASATPTTTYAYDALGDLVGTTRLGTASGTFQADNRITTYRYGQGGRLLSSEDAMGNFHTYFYDAAGRLKKDQYARIVNADNTLTGNGTSTVTEAKTTTYDLAGRALSQSVYSTISSAFTRIDFASFEYNNFDQVTRQGAGANSSGAMYQAENTYDAAGRLVATNAGDGVWKVFSYDKNGNQTGGIASAGATTSSTSTFAGLFASVGNADINGTWTLYDGRNQAVRVIEEGRDLSATVTGQTLNTYRSYNAFGEVASETNALGNAVTYTYNTMGRKLRSESPGVQITNENGSTNWVKPAEDYYYDLGGRMIGVRDANGTYAAGGTSGSPVSKGAGTGNLTTYAFLGSTGYDGSQSLISTEFHADGGKKQIFYDRLGDARAIRDELYNPSTSNLHQEERTYNKLGQLIEIKHNRATDVSDDSTRLIDNYLYDQFGQRIQHSNNLEKTAIYGESEWISEGYWEWDDYWGNYWVDTSHWSDPPLLGHATNIEKTSLDVLGRVTRQTDLAGTATTTTYTWDGALTTSIGGSALNLGGWAETTAYSGTTRTSTIKTDLYTRQVYQSGLGNYVTTSTFDAAGRLTARNITTYSTGNTAYTWYNTGRAATIVTTTGNRTSNDWIGRSTTYGYDAVGNRTREYLTSEGSYTRTDLSTTYWDYTVEPFVDLELDQTASYDALGRLVTVATAGSATAAYHYDAAGNIRRSISTYNINAYGGPITQDYWFRYDTMNRLVIDKGMQSGPTIERGSGLDILYDATGQRASVARDGSSESREIYNYDGAGRLVEIRESQGFPAPGTATSGTKLSDFTYDLMGRQLTQTDYASGTSAVYSRSATYNAAGQATSETTSLVRWDGTYLSNITNTFTSSTGEYLLGAIGQSTSANYKNGSYQTTSSTTHNYNWRDVPLQSWIGYKPNVNQAAITTTGFAYDVDGALIRADIRDGRPRIVTFRTNAEGQIVQRYEAEYDPYNIIQVGAYAPGSAYENGTYLPENWYRFGGREWGYQGENGTTDLGVQASIDDRRIVPGGGPFRHGASSPSPYADFAQSYDPINSYGQGGMAGSYTVRSTGETLSGIASALWGDSSLWYKLAEANGLAAETNLVEGQRLTIPPGVVRNTHNADSFRPYNAAKAIGDVNPSVPLPEAPPPPRRKGCGIFGAILLALVAIAVTFVLKVPVAKMFAGMNVGSSVGAGTALAGTTIGASSAAGVAGLAGAAMIGSVVSQGIGIATGIQNKFSFGAVAMAGIGAAVGGALGGISGLDKIAGSAFLGDVARGALGSAITQGIGVATGLQDKFSWAGVAAAGIGAGVGLGLGRELGKSGGFFATSFGNDFAATAASTLANAATRSVIEGSNFGDNILAALPDAIGSIVGNALGRAGAKALANAKERPRENSLTGQPSPDTSKKQENVPTSEGHSGDTAGDDIHPDDIVVTARRDSEPKLGGGSLFTLAQYRPNHRARTGGNGGPPLDPMVITQVFPSLQNSLPGSIVSILDNVLDVSGPAKRIALADNLDWKNYYVKQIREIDPSYRYGTLDPLGVPTTVEGRTNMINQLRLDRAEAFYRIGKLEPLQVETLRFLQGRVNHWYAQGLRELQAGRLDIRLSPQEALGNYIDRAVRGDTQRLYNQLGISTARGEAVQVNRWARNTPEGSYTIPDNRVGNVAFDVSLTRKTISTPQVRNFFASDFRPSTVIIVRPSQLDAQSTYAITRPR